jgi:hypothetical protein
VSPDILIRSVLSSDLRRNKFRQLQLGLVLRVRSLRLVFTWSVIVFGACGGKKEDPATGTDSGGNKEDAPSGTDSGPPVPCVHTTTDGIFLHDTDTLPVGPCVVDPNEPVCELILRDCPCENAQAPRTFYSCTCKEHAWTCEMTGQDSGVCAPLVLVSSEPCILCEDQAWTCGMTDLDSGTCLRDHCASEDGGVNDGGD